MVRRDVASLLDDLDFFPDLTAAEHLDLLARAHGNAEPEDLVDTLLDDVGLLRGRRSVARIAVVRSAPPARAGDGAGPAAQAAGAGRARAAPRHRRRVSWLADRLIAEKKSGTSILFASHDPALVDAVADQTVTLTPLP